MGRLAWRGLDRDLEKSNDWQQCGYMGWVEWEEHSRQREGQMQKSEVEGSAGYVQETSRWPDLQEITKHTSHSEIHSQKVEGHSEIDGRGFGIQMWTSD